MSSNAGFFKFRGAPPPRRVTLPPSSTLASFATSADRRSLGRGGQGSLRSPLAVLLVVAAPAILDACPICFQFEQGPVTAGMRGAVLVLMTVTAGVLTGF